MYTPERIDCSKDNYHIALNEKIMKDDAELRRGVKKVMEVIVGLWILREQGRKNLLRNDFACGS